MTKTTMIKPDSFQAWRTPKAIFKTLSKEVGGYGIDLFADDENHLCPKYFTEEQDSIMQPWASKKVCFGNPPYGGGMMEEALHKAITEVRVAKRCPGVDLLLKCDTSTKWFAKAFEECEIHLFDCRIQFDRGSHKTSAEKITGKRNGSNFANCLVRVRPEGPTGVTLLRSGKNGALR